MIRAVHCLHPFPVVLFDLTSAASRVPIEPCSLYSGQPGSSAGMNIARKAAAGRDVLASLYSLKTDTKLAYALRVID